MNSQITYTVFHLAAWDWTIAMDLFLGGLGVGAYLYAVFVSWWYNDEHPNISRVGAVLAPICVGAGVLFLFSHLGHPERLIKPFLVFNPSAPLWWGSWFQPLFIVVSLFYAFLWLQKDQKKARLRRIVGWIGAPLALFVGGYHGLLLTVIKAKPLWNTEPSTIMAVLGFAITGIVAVVLIISFFEPHSVMKSIKLTRNIVGGALILQLSTIWVWAISMWAGPEANHHAWSELNRHFGILFWVGAVGVGLILPLCIGGLTALKEKGTDKIIKSVPIITSIMILAGAYVLRYVVVMAGQIN